MRRASLAVAGLLLFVATVAHWWMVGGWCGYYDGGPKAGQEWACEGGRAVMWPLLYAFFSLGALLWTARAEDDGGLAVRLAATAIAAGLLWRIVPFELAPGTAL